MEASRTGRTEVWVFFSSGRGWTQFRVRAGYLPLKMAHIVDIEVPPLSSAMSIVVSIVHCHGTTRLCSILGWPRPTSRPAVCGCLPLIPPPHGPMAPVRKWENGKMGPSRGDTACGPWAPRIKLRQDGRVFRLHVPCPGVRVWGWSPHSVGQLGNHWRPSVERPSVGDRRRPHCKSATTLP